MFAPAMTLIDGPTALYLVWVACTLAMMVVGVVWMFRPALARQPLMRLGIGWGVVTIGVIAVSLHVFGARKSDFRYPAAPNFEIQAADGESFNLAGLRGKVVLIEFWASWCGPCREALPYMMKLHKEMNDPRFVMIGVSEDEQQGNFENFVAQHGMTWPQGWDPDGKLLSEFGSDALPSYVVIDANGRLRFLQKGYTPDTYMHLRGIISGELGGQVAALHP